MNQDLIVRGFKIDWDMIPEDSYLRSIPSIDELQELRFEAPVSFFAGENGSGKSTLLEAIAIAYGFNPEGGTVNYSFSTYDSHSELCRAVKLVRSFRKASWGYFLRAESFYNVATKEAEYSRDGSSKTPPEDLHLKSHGESFLFAASKHFRPGGFYILDEPEAALSAQGQITLLAEIHECVKQGGQFIIATHSPILLGFPGAVIYSLDEKMRVIDYEDTDSYRLTSLFLNHREMILNRLFEDD